MFIATELFTLSRSVGAPISKHRAPTGRIKTEREAAASYKHSAPPEPGTKTTTLKTTTKN
jgi:hypothetical protein